MCSTERWSFKSLHFDFLSRVKSTKMSFYHSADSVLNQVGGAVASASRRASRVTWQALES